MSRRLFPFRNAAAWHELQTISQTATARLGRVRRLQPAPEALRRGDPNRGVVHSLDCRPAAVIFLRLACSSTSMIAISSPTTTPPASSAHPSSAEVAPADSSSPSHRGAGCHGSFTSSVGPSTFSTTLRYPVHGQIAGHRCRPPSSWRSGLEAQRGDRPCQKSAAQMVVAPGHAGVDRRCIQRGVDLRRSRVPGIKNTLPLIAELPRTFDTIRCFTANWALGAGVDLVLFRRDPRSPKPLLPSVSSTWPVPSLTFRINRSATIWLSCQRRTTACPLTRWPP